MARDVRTKTHLESLVIIPNSKHGDADGDAVLTIYPIDSDDISGSPTAVFSLDEDGDITFNSLNVGGGYGSTGATIASTGAVSTNSTIQADGVITSGVTGSNGGLVIKETSAGATKFSIAGATGIITLAGSGTIDNNTDTAVINLTETTVRVTGAFDVTGNSTLASVDIGGGYTGGGSGATISAAGVLQVNGAATFDSTVTATGALSLGAGTGAIVVPASSGAVGKAIGITSGDGNGGTTTGFAGGAVSTTAGTGSAGTTTSGAGGAITFTPGASGTTTSGSAGASGTISLAGTTGGNASGAGTGGQGSNISIVAGTGGTAAAGTGGTAGTVVITAGNGGAVTGGGGTAKAGGAITITTGTGGAITTGAGLAGGLLSLIAGAGGGGSTAGGNGGGVTIASGAAGSGGTGTVGAISILQGGTGGTERIGVSTLGAIALTGATTITGTATITGIATFGNAAHAGLLLGSGTSGTPFNVGASGGKAMSFYINSSSITAGHTLEGLYVNTDFGNGTGATAAPSGEAGRFRASLKGSPSNVYGSHSTIEWISAGSTVSGGASAAYNNLVFLDSTAGGGTLCATNAELTSGGTSTDLTGATASILRLSISGTVTANKFTVPAINLSLPANLVGDNLVFDDASSANTVGGKLRITVNGATYWIMCADSHD